MSENIIKFSDQEMQSIAKLQTDYQQHIFSLGQLELEKIDLEQQLERVSQQKNNILDSWKKTQSEESNLLSSLSQKYGDGTLNIKDGTFKPVNKN